jgi:hypothetical protein
MPAATWRSVLHPLLTDKLTRTAARVSGRCARAAVRQFHAHLPPRADRTIDILFARSAQ